MFQAFLFLIIRFSKAKYPNIKVRALKLCQRKCVPWGKLSQILRSMALKHIEMVKQIADRNKYFEHILWLLMRTTAKNQIKSSGPKYISLPFKIGNLNWVTTSSKTINPSPVEIFPILVRLKLRIRDQAKNVAQIPIGITSESSVILLAKL